MSQSYDFAESIRKCAIFKTEDSRVDMDLAEILTNKDKYLIRKINPM